MQLEFSFSELPRREATIRGRAPLLGLLDNDVAILVAALYEGTPLVIDGEPCSLLPWSMQMLADRLGFGGKASAHDAIGRLKRLGLVDNGRKRLLVCWAELERRTKPNERRTIPNDPERWPNEAERSRTMAERSRTKPNDGRTIDRGDGKGDPLSLDNGPRGRLRSDKSDSDDVDVRLVYLEEAEPESDPAEVVETVRRLNRKLQLGQISRKRFDVLATAAVLASTVCSSTWLERAIDTTCRKRGSVDVLPYLESCLRNNVAEIEGLCRTDQVFDVYGKLWRWARPAVAAAARQVREKHDTKEPAK